jgi:hypothetical protein
MLYILLLTLWYQDGSFFASAYAYHTQAECAHMVESAVGGIDANVIEGVAVVDAKCVPVSNPETSLTP